MGDKHRHPGLAADVDGLPDGLHHSVGFVAHMGGVDAAIGADHLGKLHNLLSFGIAAGCVNQAGGKAHRPVLHGLPQEGLHLLQLIAGRLPVIKAHHCNAKGAVADVHSHISRLRNPVPIGAVSLEAGELIHLFGKGECSHRQLPLQKLQTLGIDRRNRKAALAPDFGGDALAGFAQAGKPIVKVGEMAPDFTVTLTDGKQVNLSTLRGKVVMLQFTASWCGVCRKEMPFIEKDIWLKHKNNPNFALIGIDRDEPLDKVLAFAKATGVTYPLGLDPGADIFAKYALRDSGITRNVLIDRDGKIVKLTRLYNEEEFTSLVQKIDEMLKKSFQKDKSRC